LALEAARFQMSRKEDSWLKFRELYRSSHEGLGLDTESLKKGFMAGFARGQLTESRSDSYDDGGAAGPDLGGGRDRESGGGGGSEKRSSSGGGSGPKVLKKGDAGHGGGKKKRRRY